MNQQNHFIPRLRRAGPLSRMCPWFKVHMILLCSTLPSTDHADESFGLVPSVLCMPTPNPFINSIISHVFAATSPNIIRCGSDQTTCTNTKSPKNQTSRQMVVGKTEDRGVPTLMEPNRTTVLHIPHTSGLRKSFTLMTIARFPITPRIEDVLQEER